MGSGFVDAWSFKEESKFCCTDTPLSPTYSVSAWSASLSQMLGSGTPSSLDSLVTDSSGKLVDVTACQVQEVQSSTAEYVPATFRLELLHLSLNAVAWSSGCDS